MKGERKRENDWTKAEKKKNSTFYVNVSVSLPKGYSCVFNVFIFVPL